MAKKALYPLLAALILGFLGMAFSHGQGHTIHKAEKAGWACELVPGLGQHCSQESLGAQIGAGVAVITVRVYDDETHQFTSTELLIRQDLYHGQPCPQEGADGYHLLPFGYYACHH